MKIEFDKAKDKVNQTRHGVPLSYADHLDWEAALVTVGERYAYDELRMRALVPDSQRLFFVAFVDRGETRRIISLRPARRNEVKFYVENS